MNINNTCVIIILLVLLNLGNLYAQQKIFFPPNEIDSLEKYYHPLYSSGSSKVEELKNFEFLNVFFFNGDCSLCLGKLRRADDFFISTTNDKEKTIFIVETMDTISFNFHRDKYQIKAPIVWDKNQRVREKEIIETKKSVQSQCSVTGI